MWICPECDEPGLGIEAALEMDADATWDEITLQGMRCVFCGAVYFAVYAESRRGALDDEAVFHRGYRAPAAAVEAWMAAATCPDGKETAGLREARRLWGGLDPAGQWVGWGRLSVYPGYWLRSYPKRCCQT